MGAEELREAADKLRTLAADATPGEWMDVEPDGLPGQHFIVAVTSKGKPATHIASVADGKGADAALIAAMNPLACIALAEWLDRQADDVESFVDGQEGWVTAKWRAANNAALAVANAVLGSS